MYPFDPLGLVMDLDKAALLKVNEIKNTTFAMFAMLGFYFQLMPLEKVPILLNPAKYLNDPLGNNLLTVIAGSAERALSL